MRRLLVTLLAIAGLVACDPTAPTGTFNAADAGNYVLRTINDTVLPYQLTTPTGTLQILSDTLFMGVDGTFVDRTHYQRVSNGVTDFPADTTEGVWTEQGSTVDFDGTDGSLTQGNFQGGALVFVGGGLVASYIKS